jgi:hypothetical protein
MDDGKYLSFFAKIRKLMDPKDSTGDRASDDIYLCQVGRYNDRFGGLVLCHLAKESECFVLDRSLPVSPDESDVWQKCNNVETRMVQLC